MSVDHSPLIPTARRLIREYARESLYRVPRSYRSEWLEAAAEGLAEDLASMAEQHLNELRSLAAR